ncbi:hypothetical protein EUX98_g4351 [Antrodiella citrinella]|uniref:ubiquitinyl hydrolase 1 n=1 Tax=Antrodiella citrinella TaxID=2447956 RepID=A0A4S4MU81_9APHY|nr:hypothetical protein EUX98_g4351 [Antrodiella citrinella]
MLPPPQPQHDVPLHPPHPPPQPPPPQHQHLQPPLHSPPQPQPEVIAIVTAAQPTSPQVSQAPAAESSPVPDHTELPSEDHVEPAPTSPQFPAIDSSWVIWSRKGRPSDAPGIIISPRANPPDRVIQKALQLPSPVASPKVKAKAVAFVPDAVVDDNASHAASKDASPEPEHTEALSSSATETTSVCSTAPDTPVPGSPLSTNTSVSLTVPSPASKPLETMEVTASAGPVVSEKVVESAVPAEVAPAAAPAPARPKPVVKSWASLLQQPADATASSSKSRLPTSSVVGFSIPASALSGSGASSGAPGGQSSVSARPELVTLINNGPTGPVAPPKIRPRGLINTGNMCFANTILQVLVYCPPFNRLFTELGKHLAGPVVGSQKDGSKATPLVDSTIQFLKEFMPEPKTDPKSKGKEREEDDFYDLDSFIPTYIYDVMKEKKRFAGMVGGYQEDAEEFLGFFLDTLEDELLSIVTSLSPPKPKVVEEPEEDPATQASGWLETKSTESPITRMFGGKNRSTLRAPHQRDSVMVEDWRSLRLDISREQVKTVQDALQYLSHPQPVQISIPTRPGQVIEATQQTLIESVPPILVLHIKRFQYDTNVGDVVKINKQVAYGPELEIAPELLAPTRRATQPIKYQLFGVLYHHGQSASGGHYTLDVLHPNRDMSDRPRAAWIRIDDELVSDVRADDVFVGGQERDDRCAYLLFYRRVGAVGGARTYAQQV